MIYKRSQLEDAICRANRAERGAARAKVLARIKRLLDVDRKLAPERGADPGQRYAFFSEARRGTGQEASFKEYEIFALDIALHLAEHGIQQADLVEILRQLRPKLEDLHRKLLSHPIGHYFDLETPISEREPGIGRHRFFLSVTAAGESATFVTKGGFTAALLSGGAEWWGHIFSEVGKAATILELTVIRSCRPRVCSLPESIFLIDIGKS